MWWDRTKERAREARDRSDAAESILLELRGILGRIETPDARLSATEDQSGAIAVDLSIPFLSSSAFDASVHSGRLTLLPPDLQEELSTIYEQIRIMRMHVDNAATSYAKGATVEEHGAVIENAMQYLRGHSEMLKPQVEAACENLRGALPARRAT